MYALKSSEARRQYPKRLKMLFDYLKNYYKAAKLFCEMNDLTLNWKRISKGLPKAKNSSNDRSPTVEEIRARSIS
jgi:hypothetical protein